MDIFDGKLAAPMLIGKQAEAFDDPNYIFELKLDGGRYMGYFTQNSMELLSKRNVPAQFAYPEFSGLTSRVHAKKCILDGEIMVMQDGAPDFSAYARRALIKDRLKAEIAGRNHPAVYVVYDIIYKDGHDLRCLPLMQRLKILSATVEENDFISISRYIEEKGTQFFRLVQQMGMEGVVAKRKDSIYKCGVRSKDWVKIKNWLDEDFIIGGYARSSAHAASLLIGQFNAGKLIYLGRVSIAKSNPDFLLISQWAPVKTSPFKQLKKHNAEEESIIWLKPGLVCKVEFADYTRSGGLRQPTFRGLRFDRSPEEVTLTIPDKED